MTLNFIYIESPDTLCKQRTGKLCSSPCPKPHLPNSDSRKLLNFEFFPGNSPRRCKKNQNLWVWKSLERVTS